jgi:hypothetical protein
MAAIWSVRSSAMSAVLRRAIVFVERAENSLELKFEMIDVMDADLERRGAAGGRATRRALRFDRRGAGPSGDGERERLRADAGVAPSSGGGRGRFVSLVVNDCAHDVRPCSMMGRAHAGFPPADIGRHAAARASATAQLS